MKAASFGKFSSALAEIMENWNDSTLSKKDEDEATTLSTGEQEHKGNSTFSFWEVETSNEMKSHPIYVR